METLVVLRVACVLAHMLGFAIGLGAVFREDLKMLRGGRVDLEDLHRTARVACRSLAVLWVSGFAIIAIDTGWNPMIIQEQPKLLAKLSVIAALTANGLAMHRIAFPLLAQASATRRNVNLVGSIGAVSGASWLYAAFLGIARPLSESFGYLGFMLLYAFALAVGIALTLTVFRPQIEAMLGGRREAMATPDSIFGPDTVAGL